MVVPFTYNFFIYFSPTLFRFGRKLIVLINLRIWLIKVKQNKTKVTKFTNANVYHKLNFHGSILHGFQAKYIKWCWNFELEKHIKRILLTWCCIFFLSRCCKFFIANFPFILLLYYLNVWHFFSDSWISSQIFEDTEKVWNEIFSLE